MSRRTWFAQKKQYAMPNLPQTHKIMIGRTTSGKVLLQVGSEVVELDEDEAHSLIQSILLCMDDED